MNNQIPLSHNEALKLKKMKEYINFDKLVDEEIEQRRKQIIKNEIDIIKLERMNEILSNDIKRIEEERDHSNMGFNVNHIFINPYIIYEKLTRELNN